MADSDPFAAIEDHAGRISQRQEVSDLDVLADRIDALEFLAEEIAQQSNFIDAYTKYCIAQEAEAASIKSIRFWSVCFTYIVMIALLGSFFLVILFPPIWLLEAGDAVKSAFILGCLVGALSLLAVILKGAFRSISDRNKDDEIPEHIRLLKETAKNVQDRLLT